MTKAQLEMEQPFLMESATSELNGVHFFSSFCSEFCPHGLTTLDESFFRSVSD